MSGTDGGSLEGLRVLVTRPAERAQGLLEGIAAAGGVPIPFPVIEIVPTPPAEVPRIADFAAVLFVSPAAVAHGIAALGLAAGDLPALGAVGPATAAALERAGLPVAIRCDRSADSEGLLRCEALQAGRIRGRRILIVRGRGGRECLARGLVERGATVEYAEVYRRERPSRYDPDQVEDCDIVTVTSVEGLDNLLEMIPAARRDRLRQRPLVVAAARIAEQARQRGFTGRIISAAQAGEAGLMAAIRQCAAPPGA